MEQMQPPQDESWWKKPENILTGLVLAIGLAQGRRDGQSTAGKIGESILGATGYRGGLEAARMDQAQKAQARQDKLTQESEENKLRGRQIAVSEEGNRIQSRQADNQQTYQQGMLEQGGKPKPMSPEEAAALRSQAGLYDAQAQYYLGEGRQPAGSGAGNKSMFGDDPVLNEMVKGMINQYQLTGAPVDPMNMLQQIQPYLNARTQLEAMRANGLMGQVVNEGGQWKVRIMGVQDPQVANQPPPVATLTETPGQVPAAAPTQKSSFEQFVAARPPVIRSNLQDEEMVRTGKGAGGFPRRQSFLDQMSEEELRAALKDKTLYPRELKMIRETLKKKAPNANSK